MAADKQQITEQLRQINVPGSDQDIVSLGFVDNVAACDGIVAVRLALPAEAMSLKDELSGQIESAVRAFDPETRQVTVNVIQAATPTPQDEARQSNPLPGVKHIIAVGAGKGGVGKSTVAVNLSVGPWRSWARRWACWMVTSTARA